MPDLYSDDLTVAEPSAVKQGRGDTQTFTLTAKGQGTAVLNGKVPGTSTDCVFPLNVTVGDFLRHPGTDIDLLAKVGQGNDLFKIYCLQRLIHNNRDDTNLFNERSGLMIGRHGELACGDVSLDAGRTLFGNITSIYKRYHIPTQSVRSRDDVKYEQRTIDAARNAIHANLRNGIAVRVACTYRPSTAQLRGGLLEPVLEGGHFAIIVGCDDAKTHFLFVEVWGGCRLKYEGGIRGHNFFPDCDYMGVFELQNTANRGPVLIQAASTGQPAQTLRDGSPGFNAANGALLEVIGGP
jgi:hypothetical protein